MYIGSLEAKSVSFVHPNTDIPFPPDVCEDGRYTWRWNTVYDSVLDARYTLEAECFVGAVVLELSAESVKKVEVLVDEVIAGSYCAESGKMVGGTLQIPVGVKGRMVTVRFYTNLIDLSLCGIELLGAREDGDPLVYPTPKAIEFLDGYAEICDVIPKSGDADEVFAASFLKERLTETHGAWQRESGAVIVIEKTCDKGYDGERYTVRTEREQITVTAGTRLTLLYGCDTILQLSERDRGVRCFQCDDHPTKAFRGFHMMLPHLSKFDFIKRLFRYVLLPLRYNTVILEITASMKFESHPEITDAWQRAIDAYKQGTAPRPPHMHAEGTILEKEDVAALVEEMRVLGFEIIPEVQSLGHVQYITLAHPELAEIDETVTTVSDTRNEDERPAAQFHHCYCPSMEESYRIVFDLIDEIVAVTKPQHYVHIGHDEIYQIGVCKRCREKDPAELLATHVKRLYDYLAAKGLGTIMWSDMLQPPPIRPYRAYRAAEMLPRDIIMLDFVWYFNMDCDLEDTLLEKGYSVAVGNLYSSHYPRYRSRVMKERMIGGQISMWVDSNEEKFGENGKLWDCIYLSEMLWNTENYDERNRRTYSHRLARDILPKMRDEVRARFCPNGYKETVLCLPRAQKPPKEVSCLCPDAIVMQGETIRVDAAFERLVFEHATLQPAPRIMWRPIDKIGDYCITYSDGSVIEVPVKYAANIMAYNTTHGAPMPQEYYRHNGYVGTWFLDPAYTGKSSDGSDVTVGDFLWENPHPKKEIREIRYRPVQNDYCGLILAGIRGLCKQ